MVENEKVVERDGGRHEGCGEQQMKKGRQAQKEAAEPHSVKKTVSGNEHYHCAGSEGEGLPTEWQGSLCFTLPNTYPWDPDLYIHIHLYTIYTRLIHMYVSRFCPEWMEWWPNKSHNYQKVRTCTLILVKVVVICQ